MKTAAVVIDNWKLPIFEKHLKDAGYTYKQFPGLTDDALVLKVDYEWVAALNPIIQAAYHECATKGKP